MTDQRKKRKKIETIMFVEQIGLIEEWLETVYYWQIVVYAEESSLSHVSLKL